MPAAAAEEVPVVGMVAEFAGGGGSAHTADGAFWRAQFMWSEGELNQALNFEIATTPRRFRTVHQLFEGVTANSMRYCEAIGEQRFG